MFFRFFFLIILGLGFSSFGEANDDSCQADDTIEGAIKDSRDFLPQLSSTHYNIVKEDSFIDPDGKKLKEVISSGRNAWELKKEGSCLAYVANTLETAAKKFLEAKEKPCKEAYDEYKEKRTKFGEECGDFGHISGTNCEQTLNACKACMTEDGDEDYCLKVRGQSLCPQLAGKVLEKAKEDAKEAKERKRDLEEELSELQQDIVEKQNEMADAKSEFEENKAELEANLTEANEEYDEAIEEQKEEVDQAFNEQTATIKAQINSSLEARHAFENAITDVHREYRNSSNEYYRECRSEAASQLSDYRYRRREAIAKGNYKKSSTLELMSKTRTSFKQKDSARYNGYYQRCLNTLKNQFKALKSDRDEALKRVDQKKAEYVKKLSDLKKDLAAASETAKTSKQKAAKRYAKKLTSLYKKFKKQENTLMKRFQISNMKISNSLNVLQNQLQKKQLALEQVNQDANFNLSLAGFLNKNGVGEKEKTKSAFEAAYSAFKSKTINLKDDCHCENETPPINATACNLFEKDHGKKNDGGEHYLEGQSSGQN